MDAIRKRLLKLVVPILPVGLLPFGVASPPPDAHAPGGKPPAGNHRSFADVAHWAKIFDDPERMQWQKPLEVLAVLALQQGEVVADLGAGTGFFTVYLAAQVGEHGRVYAVDTEQGMLDYIMKRPGIEASRVIPVLATPHDPKLPEGEVDLVLIVDTWHHIGDRLNYLPRLRRALAPGGRVVVIDYREGELPVGPPPTEKLSRQTVVREFEKAGWRLAAESVALPYQYFLTFYPPGS